MAAEAKEGGFSGDLFSGCVNTDPAAATASTFPGTEEEKKHTGRVTRDVLSVETLSRCLNVRLTRLAASSRGSR